MNGVIAITTNYTPFLRSKLRANKRQRRRIIDKITNGEIQVYTMNSDLSSISTIKHPSFSSTPQSPSSDKCAPIFTDIASSPSTNNHPEYNFDNDPRYISSPRHDTSIYLFPDDLRSKSSRLYSPKLYDLDHSSTTCTRSKRYRDRVNYFECDTNAPDQHFSSLVTSTDTAVPITSNQDSISWKHFIRGRITLDFSPIVASYYRFD